MSTIPKFDSNALSEKISRRRFAVQLSLGSAALLLAACGGGGGSGLVEDNGSSNDDTARLRRIYDELQPGMTTEDVRNLVGRTPDSGDIAWLAWEAPGGTLSVTFDGGERNGFRVVNSAGWGSVSESLVRSLL